MADFTKASLVKSKGFTQIERGILSMKLDPKKTYTKEEALQVIEKFKGGIR